MVQQWHKYHGNNQQLFDCMQTLLHEEKSTCSSWSGQEAVMRLIIGHQGEPPTTYVLNRYSTKLIPNDFLFYQWVIISLNSHHRHFHFQ